MSLRSARSRGPVLLCIISSVCFPAFAHAFELVDRTRLASVDHRTRLHEKVQAIMDGRYELANGAPVDFEKWYRQQWIDISFEFMTDLNENLGLVWGFSTGERGQKYVIEPSIRLGLAMQFQPNRQSVFQISASWLFEGRLREKPCIADYGEIGGLQTVNCRLAATILEPAETLTYLLRESPRDRFSIGARYQLIF